MYTLTLAERVYLARYYEIDGSKLMAALLNRSTQAVFNIINTMKYNGEYDLYRGLSEEEFEKILNCAEVKHGAIEGHDNQ